MEDSCVIDYHRLEELKKLLDDYYEVNLPRAYVKVMFNGTEAVKDISSYGIEDPIVLANAQLTLGKRLSVETDELSGELLEASVEEFLS